MDVDAFKVAIVLLQIFCYNEGKSVVLSVRAKGDGFDAYPKSGSVATNTSLTFFCNRTNETDFQASWLAFFPKRSPSVIDLTHAKIKPEVGLYVGKNYFRVKTWDEASPQSPTKIACSKGGDNVSNKTVGHSSWVTLTTEENACFYDESKTNVSITLRFRSAYCRVTGAVVYILRQRPAGSEDPWTTIAEIYDASVTFPDVHAAEDLQPMTVYVFQWTYVKSTGVQGYTYETTIETYPNAPRSAPAWVGFYFTVRNDLFYGDDSNTNMTVVFWDANSCENGTCHNEADNILSNTVDFFPVSGGGSHSSVESFTSYVEYKNQSSNGQYVLFGRNWGPYPSAKISLNVSISKQTPNSKPRRSAIFGVTDITGCYLHIYWNAVSGLPRVTYRVDYAPEGHFGADRKNISLTVKDVKASLSLHGAAKQVLVHIRAVREGTAGEPLVAKILRLTDTCSSRTMSSHSGAFSSLRSTPSPSLQPAGMSGIVSTSNKITVSPSPMTTSIGAGIRPSKIQASNISLTHIPTTPTPALKCWTDWFNIDNPGWTGDYEKLDTLRRSGYKVCKRPDAVRCRTVQTHIDAKLTGRKVTCSPLVGFFCINSDQVWGKRCLDYEVKFLCPCDYVNAPTKPPFDLRLGCWTAWLDRDGPGGTGDYEQRNLFSRPICDRPGAVQCRRTSNHQEALKTGQNLFCTPAMGLVCINKNQPNGGMCYNYEVRFLCPCPNYKDLFHNLTDTISTESSPLNNPTLLLPITPTAVLKCWTDWFNIDNPGWTGDYEKLETLRNSGYKVCKQPTAVRCRTVHTHIDAKLTGRKVTCSPSVGFFCINSEQGWGKTCLDYEVKFLCPCNYVDAPTKPPFDLRLGCWTAWLDRDVPGGTGDYEQRNLFSRPICDRPGSVQCRRTSNHQAALKTGQKLFCTPAMGLVCINENQPSGKMCYNYEVRFLCPCPDGLTKVPPTSQLISSLQPLQSGIKNKTMVPYYVLGAIGILLIIIALVFIRFKIQRKRVLNINERESDNTDTNECRTGEMEFNTPPPGYSVAVMEMESGEL